MANLLTPTTLAGIITAAHKLGAEGGSVTIECGGEAVIVRIDLSNVGEAGTDAFEAVAADFAFEFPPHDQAWCREDTADGDTLTITYEV